MKRNKKSEQAIDVEKQTVFNAAKPQQWMLLISYKGVTCYSGWDGEGHLI